MQQKKIPVRHCLGCNEGKPKRELVRVVRTPQGEIALDSRGKMPGRGAYLCPRVECLNKARKAKRLERALDREIPPEIYAQLEEQIAALSAGEKEE